ncbi:hypothetical protein LPJ53_005311 [Coemansia erecta]|uniref:Vacuolar protein sorting-associated protein 54 n=1 Tax=Coemansia erecta TaxID=147472 RepID=A0A9W8CQN3_9FUNG|nr:hypothetical protein LPJ53_005311 [Coemansia erecta]
MKRQSGFGIIRQGAEARGTGGSSYFQRRAQPMPGAGEQMQQHGQQPPTPTPLTPRPPAESGSLAAGAADTEPPAEPAAKQDKAAGERLSGLNAIAVLTNHPNKLPSRIHRNELPAVPRTHYPKIRRSDFDSYLEETTTLFERYKANAETGYQIAADGLDRYEAAIEDAEKVLDVASHTYSMDSTTMAERLKTLDATRSEFGLDSVSEYAGNGGAGGGGGLQNAKPSLATSLPGIEDIPTIFFEENFDLRDPATFDIATQVVLGPQSATAGLFVPEKSDEASTQMQETLSAYMDVVEAYLTREISRRSPAFFAALSTLEELHAETDRCIEKIHVLRDDLKRTALTQCSPGLELIRLRRRQEHMSALLSDVELLGNMRHIQPTIDELIASGDCIGALNLIMEAQEMIDPVNRQPDALSGRQKATTTRLKDTKAFGFLSSNLNRSLAAVSSFAEQELAALALRDMREFVDDGLASTTDGLLSRSKVDIYQVNLSMQLTPFICGLVRTGGIANALKMYRDSLMSETVGLIEALYPNGFPRSHGHALFNDASQQRILGTAVRGQTFDQFRTMLGQQQELLLLIISHISMVRRAILSVLDENRPADVSEGAEEQTTKHEEPAAQQLSLLKRYDSAKSEVLRSLNDTFDAFMDVAHVRCAKLLNHRSEQNARLSLVGFHSLYTSIWRFIEQYEALGGKMCFGLRGTLTAQAKAFLSNFHNEKSRQIHILIENEQWVQAEVPIDFQNLVNQVIDAAYASGGHGATDPQSPLLLGMAGAASNGDGNSNSASGISLASAPNLGAPFANSPLSLATPTPISAGEPLSASRQSTGPPRTPTIAQFDPSGVHGLLLARNDSDAASIRSVDTAGMGLMHIGGEAFHVVGCSLVLVKSVVEYLQCAVNIPMLITDVLQRLVEVFKAFNSRTCQVVLGAGAMRSAGLKNISAKHLALASESLSLCMELIPYAKECLRHVMSPSQEVLLTQLDRTVNDFSNHQGELHRKLVTIMSDRAEYHGRMLVAVKWDDLEPATQPPVPAMDALVKEVRKLHKVLKRYLPTPALRSVFSQIFAMYETKLTPQYQKIRIASAEGKRQLMLNSQYLLRRLRALDSSVSVDWELEVVVNNIDLVKPYQPSSDASTAASSSSPVPASEPTMSQSLVSPSDGPVSPDEADTTHQSP